MNTMAETRSELRPAPDDQQTDDTTPDTTASPAPCVDPELQHLTDVWPTLPKVIRLGILAMIEAARVI